MTDNELTPALLVDSADATNAADIADLLVGLLSDPDMPQAMRNDIRSRIADLYRRFPDAFDGDLPA